MSSQDQALVSIYSALIAAWNAQDAGSMSALFSAAGAQVGFDGSEARGPESILEHLAPIFRDHPTQRFAYLVRETLLLTEDIGVVRAIAGMVPRDSLTLDASKNVIQSLVVRKENGQWKIALFQNTPARLDGRPEAVAAMSSELQAAAHQQLARTGDTR